jgi:hypothetical protein
MKLIQTFQHRVSKLLKFPNMSLMGLSHRHWVNYFDFVNEISRLSKQLTSSKEMDFQQP